MGMFSSLERKPAEPVDPTEHEPPTAEGADPHGKPPAKADKGNAGKTSILVVLSVVGVVIAWITYKHQVSTSAAAQSANTTSPAYAAGTGTVAGASTDPTTGTDPTAGFASYLANLSGEIATLQGQIGALGPVMSGAPVTTPSSPSKPPAFQFGSAAAGDKYIRDRQTGSIYQVQQGGLMYHLSPSQWAATQAGNPKVSYTQYGAPAPAKKPAAKAPAKK
jgi:hypothetical protein